MPGPTRALNFQNIFGTWDPILLFLLGGAVAATFVDYRLVLHRPHPLLAEVFQLPTRPF